MALSLSEIKWGKAFIKGDRVVWMIFFFLCCISIIEVFSASSRMTFKSGNHTGPLVTQFTYLFGAFVIVLLMHRIPCSKLVYFSPFILPFSWFLLALALLTGGELNGTNRWLQICGISVQPSEIVKGGMIFWTALILGRSQLVRKLDNGKIISGAVKGNKPSSPFWWITVPLIASCAFIFKDNISTALMLFTVILIMMILGHIPWKYIIKLVGTLVIAGIVALYGIMNISDDILERIPMVNRTITLKHRLERFGENDAVFGSKEWKEKQLDDKNSQSTYAKIAIANSNGIGLSIGNSKERDFLQHAESDFIYAIIIEETGLIGSILVMWLYLWLLMRTGRIAQKCRKHFPAYLVMGLGIMMTIQALVNMAVAVGAIPVTGQTLPLISRGGTSIFITSTYFAVILSVSRYTEAAEIAKNIEEPVTEGETNEYASEGNMS